MAGIRKYGTTLSWEDDGGQLVWLELDVTTEETETGSTQVQTHQTEIGAITDGCLDDPDVTTVAGVVSRCPTPASDPLGTGRTVGSYQEKTLDLPAIREWVKKVQKLDIPSVTPPLNPAAVVGAIVGAIVGGPPEFEHLAPKSKSSPSAKGLFWTYGADQPRPFEVFAVLEALRLTRTMIRVTSPIVDRSGMLITSVEASRSAELGLSAAFTITLQRVSLAVAETGITPEPAVQPRKAVVASTNGHESPVGDGEPVSASALFQGYDGFRGILEAAFPGRR